MKTTLSAPDQRTSLAPIIAVAILTAGLAIAITPANSADPQRGLMLYETQCTGCHDSVFHLVGPRVAQSYDGISSEVARWAETIDLEWTKEEIADVTEYLNTQFYKYPCQDRLCSSAQSGQLTLTDASPRH